MVLNHPGVKVSCNGNISTPTSQHYKFWLTNSAQWWSDEKAIPNGISAAIHSNVLVAVFWRVATNCRIRGDTFLLGPWKHQKKVDGLVYSRCLLDYQGESPESGIRSMMINVEIDCQTLASKDLSYVLYEQHMAEGIPSRTDTPKITEIVFYPMITPRYRLTKLVCNSVDDN